ncbi:7-carboxy-7-deazaguanine synthase QueE [archaeon]|nr:7-carboxy-7-deazaguanine synthase QueE [archaeon]
MSEGWISEVFLSVQGEGVWAGLWQVFVRVAGCPLSCRYCDTLYARERASTFTVHQLDSQMYEGKNPVSPEEVVLWVKRVASPVVRSVSITGGEPCAQPDFVHEICKLLHQEGFEVHLDTSGFPEEGFLHIVEEVDYVSLDFKDPKSQREEEPPYEQILVAEFRALERCIRLEKPLCIKIPVWEGVELEWMSTLGEALAEHQERILAVVLTPITETSEVKRPSIRYMLQLCEQLARYISPKRIRIIPQLHRALGVP